ncbi:hypothetical protein DFH28DRAFT_1106880 [Melampsora americana]|nr:hypothetical protein DFH28DRAFT_1106880 [Melampsora americana]
MYSNVCSTSTLIAEPNPAKPTNFPNPLRVTSTPMMTKHDVTAKIIVDSQAVLSSGVIFDMVSAPTIKPLPLITRVFEGDMKNFDQIKPSSSIPPLSTLLDKKNRRKMSVQPTSCDLFWENEGSNNDDSISTPTTTTTLGSGITTPASIFPQSSTPIRADSRPSYQVMDRRIILEGKRCLRPNILRFSSVPHTEILKTSTENIGDISLLGGTRPNMQSMGRRTTVGEMEHRVWDKLEIPGPDDTVRFGNALSRALILHLSQVCDIGTDEAQSNSYWSSSE